MKHTFIIIILAILSNMIYMPLKAQNIKNDIIGQWISQEKNTKFLFYKKNNKYFAKIVSLSEAKEGVKSGDIVILDLEYNSKENIFEDGEFHWAGNELSCEARLINNKTLEIEISKLLFSRKLIWTRIK